MKALVAVIALAVAAAANGEPGSLRLRPAHFAAHPLERANAELHSAGLP